MFRRRFMARRQVGLMFTDHSSSKLNAQQAGITYGNSPTGSVTTRISYATTGNYSNLSLYKVEDNSMLTTQDNQTYIYVYIVLNYHNSLMLLTYENNTVKYEAIDNLANYSTKYSYQWVYSGLANNFYLYNRQNQTLYLSAAEDSSLELKQASNATHFSLSGAVLNKLGEELSNWYLYADSAYTRVRLTENEYTAFLYSFGTPRTYKRYGVTRYEYTMTLKSNSTLVDNEELFLVVKNSSGSYYLIGKNPYSGNGLYLYNFSPNINGSTLIMDVNTGTGTMSNYILISEYSNNSIKLKVKSATSLFLTMPGTLSENAEFSLSSSGSAFPYSDTNGIYVSYYSTSSISFGVKNIGTQLDVTSVKANTGTTLIFKQNTSTWALYDGALTTGDTYAIAIRKAPTDPDHPGDNTASYYLVGYDGTNLVAHEFATLEDIVVTSDCEFTATSGTNGCGLVIGNKGLNVNNNNLAMLDVSADWFYIGDASVPDNSRLWTVTTQTTDYYTEYANSDLEANTQATDTTCDIFLVQNGKVQIQADEFVDGETYVLVFVDNGNHYAACVNGTDIVPVLYANSLPKNLPSDYHFVAEASGQGFILKHNNQAMGVAVNTKLTLGYSAVWTYTGTE